MNARILAVAASLALGSVAAQAGSLFEGEGSNAPAVAATSQLSRADVVAQVAEANRNGSMAVIGDSMNFADSRQGASSLSRAEVSQQAAQALHAGRIANGESYGE
ncbi:MAG: hypothetical protein ACN6O3_05630 [Comamonas sp.]